MGTSKQANANPFSVTYSVVEADMGRDGLYGVMVNVSGDVVCNWKDALTQAVDAELRASTHAESLAGTGSFGANFEMYQAYNADLKKVVEKIAKKVITVPPKVDFKVIKTEKGDGVVVKVYYGGKQGQMRSVKLPSTTGFVGLTVDHDTKTQLVTITANNPLFPVPDTFVVDVEKALQANAVNAS